MNGPIYQPTGRAGEYGDYAINIYTGCTHGCVYCYAARNAKRWGKDFTEVEPRKDIVEAVRRQLDREKITDKLIHLCFTCDPYPAAPVDSTPTREIIKAIKESGNHVQILTKGGLRALRDLDLLDGGDWFGVTLTGTDQHIRDKEPGAGLLKERLESLQLAHDRGIKTWVSFEPVYSDNFVFAMIRLTLPYVNLVKIGKLNYYPSEINWGEFGRQAESLCLALGQGYYIKDDLRKEMEK